MQNLVPHFILEKNALDESCGQFATAALFIDISGFSAVTHSLSQHGSEAAEIMADIMHRIFEPLVDAVYAQGGFISGFAGDAFTALFPVEQSLLHALAAALAIQAHINTHPVQDTAYGRFPFAIKLGLGEGCVDWGIIRPAEAEQFAYYFSGSAIEAAAQAEHYAQPGNLILSPAVTTTLASMIQSLPAGDQGYVRLINLTPGAALTLPVELPKPLMLAGQEMFTPKVLLEQTNRGEFRQVVTVFINLMGVKSHAELEPFVQAVFALQRQYGGHLARVDFGDKGCNLLLFWGAPISYEDDVERALHFTLALGEHTPSSYKAGMTFCPMYAGLAGSIRRGEFTCYGDGINLAARLMMAAPWGSFWLDERLARRTGAQFVTEKVGEQTFKGFDTPQPVYALLEKAAPQSGEFFKGKMIGHTSEMARLEEFVHPLVAGEKRFAGILSVEGEAGLGKSRLVSEFLLRLTAPSSDGKALVQCALCQTDPTLRAPFNPWRYWLRSYFEQSPAESVTRNKRAFGRVLDNLIAATQNEALQAELNHSRSFLGALLDLHWDNSPYAGMEPQGRYEYTLTALTTLIRAEALRCPLVINLEDVQWLDEDSLAVVVRLTRAAADAPFAILATARPVVGGKPVFGDVPYQRLELGLLNRQELEELACDVLGGLVDAGLSDLLDKQAEGNPFFAEQILLFLREQDRLVQQDGQFHLAQKDGESALPSDVRMIFTSRLDSLSGGVRELVQTAAILGREFEVHILAEMLHQAEHLPGDLHAAESSAIWSALSEIRYIFKHALLRDAAYEMQIKARRRELHRLAAETLLKLYEQNLDSYYAEIAYHYQAACRQGLAEVRPQAIDYLEKAGQRAAKNFENTAAVQFFSNALELLEESETENRWNLLLQREDIYHLIGARESQFADLEALQALAEASQRPIGRALAALRCSRYNSFICDYPQAIQQAQAAAGFAQAGGRVDLEAEAQFQGASALSDQAEFILATEHAQQALALARSAGQTITQADCLNLLGTIVGEQGDNNASRDYYERALALFQAAGSRLGEGKVLTNLGVIYYKQGDLSTAQNYFEQGLDIQRATGNRNWESICLLNLGEIYLQQGDLPAALSHYQQSLDISYAMDDRDGESYCLNNLGNIHRTQGNLAAARSCYQESLNLCRAIGTRNFESQVLRSLGLVFIQLGDFAAALEMEEQSLALARTIGSQELEGLALCMLADIRNCQGQIDQALELVAQAQSALQQTDIVLDEKEAAGCILGHIHLLRAEPALAHEHFAKVQAIAKECGNQAWLAEGLAGLAQAAVQLGDLTAARTCLEQAMPVMQGNPPLAGAFNPFRALLGIGQSWLALDDPQGKQVICSAYQLLQERAVNLEDETGRQMFLENVPENRKLCALYAKLQGGPLAYSQQEIQPAEPSTSPAPIAPQSAQATVEQPRAAQIHISSSSIAPNPEEQSTPSPTPMPDNAAIAAQIAAQITALLGQSGQAQGMTINIHLGDIHIERVEQLILGAQPSTLANQGAQVQPQGETNPASSPKETR